MEQTESDVRLSILNSFLTTPHRKLAELAPLHTDALARDPLFYAHLAPWYFARGEVRDHKVLFVAHLALSEYPEFRSTAWVLVQSLAPHEVAQTLDYITKTLKKVAPRPFREAVRHYLNERERNPRQFDGAVMRARKYMKYLYKALHLHPGPRAQAILFDGCPPQGSSPAALKRLSMIEDDAEQARLIIEHHIPYPIAVAGVKSLTPALLVALLTVMSPQEVINSMGMFKRRGALDNPDLKKLIDGKLEGAKKDKRVSTLKTKKAASSVALDAETEAKLLEIADVRIAAKTEITRPTALFADKSHSMSAAIEVAKQIAALVSAVATHGLYVYAFDSGAFPLTVSVPEGSRPRLSDWEQAFRYIKANGSTAIGAPLVKMRKDGILVEQIILVTDEEEVTAPRFVNAYKEYSEALHIKPPVHIVKVREPSDRSFEQGLQKAGIEFSVFPVEKSDYYAYPSLLALLAAPGRQELIDTIMATPLPVRPDAREQVRV